MAAVADKRRFNQLHHIIYVVTEDTLLVFPIRYAFMRLCLCKSGATESRLGSWNSFSPGVELSGRKEALQSVAS